MSEIEEMKTALNKVPDIKRKIIVLVGFVSQMMPSLIADVTREVVEGRMGVRDLRELSTETFNMAVKLQSALMKVSMLAKMKEESEEEVEVE
jgi:hypothetical protein